ncbi:MAG TPA: MBL fold metallo-hydrolase, partial [Planctomycetota bacterium]|nr:MBL fold metallo-hydrolase [Planctomycetota bacterium]
GTLIGGTPFTLALSGAAPHSPAFLVVGQSQVDLPFLGGVLVPAPQQVAGPFDAGPTGSIQATFTMPQGAAPGLHEYWQVWLLDGAAPQGVAATNALRSTTPTQAGGGFPHDWIHGGNCGSLPSIQVHRYNADTYILRQSKCTNFEGPFMYLLFGEDEVLLEDTGAGGIQIGPTVYGIIADWLKEKGKASIHLTVAHSHGHGDHVQGDSQFLGQPNTTVVGTSTSAVLSFFGFQSSTDVVQFDLGGRVLDVLHIPGHQAAHIAFYDRDTGLLLTGDSLYPGYLFLSAATWNTYRDSISRLRDFVEDKPVAWVLGTHVEMKSTPFEAYPYGTNFQPDEHDLQLEKHHLQELDDALDLLPVATTEVHADFIING